DQLDFLAMINTVNESQTDFVGEIVAKALHSSKVGILGLSYKRNLKVHVLSPTVPLAKRLQRKRKEVLIQDPYYSAEEVKQIAGVETFSYPGDLKTLDAIIVAVPHSEYTETPLPMLT